MALKKKKYLAAYKQSSKYKVRRKAKKLIKSKQVVSNTKNPARHKTGKLSPKEDVKCIVIQKSSDAKKKAGQKKRKTPCANCKQFHPGLCPEPNYSKKRKLSSKVDRNDIASLF